LRLHGSVARDEASAVSDIDLIADLDPAKPVSLLDMVGLEITSLICLAFTWTSRHPTP
jgi:predicted nucleotidyltransferase